jgi:hypothetical protein
MKCPILCENIITKSWLTKGPCAYIKNERGGEQVGNGLQNMRSLTTYHPRIRLRLGGFFYLIRCNTRICTRENEKKKKEDENFAKILQREGIL